MTRLDLWINPRNLWIDLSPTLGDRYSRRPVPAPTGTAGDRNPETPSDLHVYLSPLLRGQVGTGQSATCPPVPPPYRGTGIGTGAGTAQEAGSRNGLQTPVLTTAGTARVAPVRAALAAERTDTEESA